MHELIIWQTSEEDWEMLKLVRLESLKDSPDAFLATYEQAQKYSELQWRKLASQKSQFQFFLAIKNHKAVGIVGGTTNTTLEFSLIAMWVNSEFRGCGIADYLISTIKAYALHQGHTKIFLNVSPQNSRAVRFYLRHGFYFIPEWDTSPLSSGETTKKMQCIILQQQNNFS